MKTFKLIDNSYIEYTLSPITKKQPNVLILGNMYGMFGRYVQTGNRDTLHFDERVSDIKLYIERIKFIKDVFDNDGHIHIISDKVTDLYFKQVRTFLDKRHKHTNQFHLDVVTDNSEYKRILEDKYSDMKFDYIIQNPPYNGTLYMDFFNKGLDLLSSTGEMIIICPSTWCINLNPYSKSLDKFNSLKKRIENVTESICIEKMSKQFNISIHQPLSIVHINNKKTSTGIRFSNCGYKSVVYDINDCNLIGSHKLIRSILNKIEVCPCDRMINHITREKVSDKDIRYLRYAEIISSSEKYSNTDIMSDGHTEYFASVLSPMIHQSDQKLYDDIPLNMFKGASCCVYGTEEELDNWKYFAFNNKIGKFINAVLIISADAKVAIKMLCWLVDRKYTDDEIYEMYEFDADEIDLIEHIVKRFEWKSKWFQRMFTGDTSITVDSL